MPRLAMLLATSRTTSREVFGDVAPLLAMLAGAAIVGFVVVALLRRWFRRTDTGPATGFTLHDLRLMRESGELSEEEFQRARASLLESMTAGADNRAADDKGSARRETRRD